MPFYKVIFTSLILVFTLNANAQFHGIANTNPYWEGEIMLTDGTTKKGLIRVPHKDHLRKVAYKKNKSSKKQKIKTKKIASVYLKSPNEGNEFLFEQSRMNYKKSQKTKRKHLLLVIAKNDYASFYVTSQTYDVDKKTEDIVPTYRYQRGNDIPTTGYYIKKKKEESAYLVYQNNTAMRFKKFAEDYFQEDPELVKDIQSKKVKLRKDLSDIISRYMKTTANM